MLWHKSFSFVCIVSGMSLVGGSVQAATAIFTFEGLAASTGDVGDLTYLELRDAGLVMDITRPGSTFDVKKYPIDNLPAEAGDNGLSPFSDRSSATPFVLNFSQPVNSIVLWTGDYGEDTPDIVDLRAFNGSNGTGTQLAFSQVSIPTLDPSAFTPNYDVLAVAPSGGGILSATLLGGTPGFEHSVYYDNIVVEFDPVVAPEPIPAPSFLLPIQGSDPIFVNTITTGQCGENIAPGCYNEFHNQKYNIDFDVNDEDLMQVIAAADGVVWAIGTGSVFYDEDGNLVNEVKKCTYTNNCIIIKHADGYYTEYAEMTTLRDFEIGQSVLAGDQLGTVVGSEHQNTGPYPDHLHFQVHYSADEATNLSGTSAIPNTALTGLTLGGKTLEEFSLDYNGNQGRLGFLFSQGDVTPGNFGVIEEGNTSVLGSVSFSSVVVAESEDGALFLNGPMDYEVIGALEVGAGSGVSGEMVVSSGAHVSANEIRVGTVTSSSGELVIEGTGTLVETVGPSSTLVGFAIDVGATGRIEVRDGATLRTPQVLVGEGGTLVHNSGTVEGDVIALGGTISPGASPGTGNILGDLRLESGLLILERELNEFDRLFVSGDIFIGSSFGINWYGDFFDGETVDIFDYLISDYLDDSVRPSILFEDVTTTASLMRLFTHDEENVGKSVWFNLGGHNVELVGEYRAESLAPVPLPASLPLLIATIGSLGLVNRKRTTCSHARSTT